jgi:hypothetical protein
MEYNPEKFRELMLYVSTEMEDDEAFGSTVLNKALFYSDFLAFRQLGASITGASYQKLDHGPAPRCLLAERQALVDMKKAIVREVVRGPYAKKQLIPLVPPNLDVFSGREIALVDRVIGKLRGRDAAEVSEISHNNMGWLAVGLREEIPYSTIFILPPKEATPSQVERAIKIEAELGNKSA